MRKLTRTVLFLALLLGLAGCSGLNQAAIEGQAGSSKPGSLFYDDFSNPSSGWETWSDANGSFVAYQNGGLRILVKEKQFDFWSRPGKRFIDARIEVDAIKVAGPNDNDFGLICRYQDRNNFYAFLISSDGYAGILKVEEGAYKMLSGSQMSFDQNIHQGEALNHLEADCIGQSLSFTANGKPVAQAQDNAFAAGEVGMIAGTNATPGVDIFFDNFLVSKP